MGRVKNPLCGDAVEVGVALEGDVITKIEIQASGCGISTASASMMSDFVEGRSVQDAMSALEVFKETLSGSAGLTWPASISDLLPFSRLRESPTRVPCALIGWFALKDALRSARNHLEN